MKDNILLNHEWLNKATAPVPPVPRDKKVKVPIEDDVDNDSDYHESETEGTAWFIIYENSKREESKRRISINGISENNGILYISAWCHERKAVRKFRTDRIKEVIDIATGEVYESQNEIRNIFYGLMPSDQAGQTKSALKDSRHTLIILRFLARCDGNYVPEEEDIIFKFLADEFFDKDLDDKEITKYIRKLYPSKETYIKSVKAIYPFRGQVYLRKVIKYARQLIAADGIITIEETDFELILEEKLKN